MDYNALTLELANDILTDEDVLSFASKIMQIRKKKRYLEKHKYSIKCGPDGRWFTRFPKKGGGSVVRAFRTREELEEAIVSFYEDTVYNPTVKELFELVTTDKFNEGNITESTVTRNRNDFKRYFSEFGERDIKSITPDDVEGFIRGQKVEHQLSAKAYTNLTGITRSIFKYARKKDLVDFRIDDILEDIEWGKNAFRKPLKSDEDDVFRDDEVEKLSLYFKERPTGKHLGLLLLFGTGLRIGELSALKWEDVLDGELYIHRTETTWVEDRVCHCEVVDLPKTKAGERFVPIPTYGVWILERLREMNPTGEYVFMLHGSRTRAVYFRKALYNACDAVGIPRRSPHKIRKTYASILLDHGVAEKFIVETMGHSSIAVTKGSYARRRKSASQRAEVINSIPEFVSMSREETTL